MFKVSAGFAAAVLGVLVSANPALSQGKKGGLDSVLKRWTRDFKAGRIDPDDVRGAARKPYVSGKLLTELPNPGPGYNRLAEARDIFGLAVKRGSQADSDKLLEIVKISLTKKGGRFWERQGKFSRFRIALLEVMSAQAPNAMRLAVLTRVRDGIGEPRAAKPAKIGAAAGADVEGGQPGRRHAEPRLAAALIPLLGRWAEPSFRVPLEHCLEVEDSGVQVAAADALGRLEVGTALRAVASTLRRVELADDVGIVASAVGRLVHAKKVKPKDRDLKYTIKVAQERILELESWRSRIAIVPIFRHIRSRSSVPVLIGMLEDANKSLKKSGRGPQPFSGTLMTAMQEALVDLSGFYAGAREPEKWRGWWTSVKDKFVLAPVRKEKPSDKGKTVAKGFFGIPVTGNRVAFVFDISGSMQWPYEAVSVAGGAANRAARGAPLKGKHESRFERAKKELMRAVDGLAPDAKFNVIFFSTDVKIWKKKLVDASAKQRKALEKYLDRLIANGGTNLYDGVNTALKIKFRKKREDAYSSRVDELFVLSDGSPTLGTITNTSRILEVVRDWNRGAQVRIHAIYIGNDKVDEAFSAGRITRLPGNMKGEDFMKALAEQNDGRFVQPNK